MFIQFILDRLPIEKQVTYLIKRSTYLGTRKSENRKPHLYLFGKKIAEVLFENDDNTKKPEKLIWLPGISQLESHLHQEFKSSSF